MQNLYLIFTFFLLSNIGLSQTEQIEKDNIANKYSSGEITSVDYQKMGKVWQDIISSYPNGYPEFPINEYTGLVEFEYVKTYEGKTKKIIFDRIHEWAALSFGNINEVLHYKNYDNGKIILKGQFEIIHRGDYQKFFGGLRERVISRDCHQTYIFTIKDNKIKLQVGNLEYEFSSFTVSNGSYIERTTKESLHSLYPITDGTTDEWKSRLDIIYKTKIRIEGLVGSLDSYIKNVDADYSF